MGHLRRRRRGAGGHCRDVDRRSAGAVRALLDAAGRGGRGAGGRRPEGGQVPVAETETAGSGAAETGSPAESTAAKISAGKTAVGGADAAGGKSAKKAAKKTAAGSAAGSEVPEIVELLDYPSLTLAQLRARMRTLSVEDLRALLEYESATRARDPFETMLSNRIANASTK